MRRLLALSCLTAAAAVALVAPGGPASAATAPATAASVTTLRLDGIGPLKLGMTRTAAVRTGWLSNRGTGCELAGPPLAITYRLDGAAAPAGLAGSAEFNGGKLTSLSFVKGVRTAAGVVVGTTTTAQMVSRYRAKGYRAKATFSPTFGATFVDVTKNGRHVIGGFATGKVVTDLAIPRIQVCE
jgi:hypothetical protein